MLELKKEWKTVFAVGVAHLSRSYEWVKGLDLKKTEFSDEELEKLESFSSRFARAMPLPRFFCSALECETS